MRFMQVADIACRDIEAVGGTVEKVEQGKHVKIYWHHPKTGKHLLTCSLSCSDWRAARNNRSIIRRLASRGEAFLVLGMA
jgi:hypothetical protein